MGKWTKTLRLLHPVEFGKTINSGEKIGTMKKKTPRAVKIVNFNSDSINMHVYGLSILSRLAQTYADCFGKQRTQS